MLETPALPVTVPPRRADQGREQRVRLRAGAALVARDGLPRPARPAIRAPRLNRCATIAVVSPKGGVGKTTHDRAARLAAGARRAATASSPSTPTPTTARSGRTLTPDHDVFVDDLVDVLDRPDLSVTALDAHLGRAFEGLMVLPAPTDPSAWPALDEDAYTRVIERLQSLVGILVLDCGTGLQEPAARAAQACADQLVLVTDAHPSTASLVAEAAELLRTVGPADDARGQQAAARARSRASTSAASTSSCPTPTAS